MRREHRDNKRSDKMDEGAAGGFIRNIHSRHILLPSFLPKEPKEYFIYFIC